MAVEWAPGPVQALVRAATFRGVVKGTELVHDRATVLIQQPPKTGRVYRRRGVTHQASAPGEAPATDLGSLVQSGATYYAPEELLGRVNWSSGHAAPLEFGTEKMEPRPFARRALEEARPEIEGGIADEIRAALSSSAGRAFQGGQE